MTAGRRHRTGQLPEAKAAIVAVNIRTLRQRNGWTQRGGRQRGFTAREVRQLAAIFGVSSGQLTAQCANCNGQPPEGFACLACGAADHGGCGDRC